MRWATGVAPEAAEEGVVGMGQAVGRVLTTSDQGGTGRHQGEPLSPFYNGSGGGRSARRPFLTTRWGARVRRWSGLPLNRNGAFSLRWGGQRHTRAPTHLQQESPMHAVTLLVLASALVSPAAHAAQDIYATDFTTLDGWTVQAADSPCAAAYAWAADATPAWIPGSQFSCGAGTAPFTSPPASLATALVTTRVDPCCPRRSTWLLRPHRPLRCPFG